MRSESREQGLRESGRAERQSEQQTDRGQSQRGHVQRDQTVGQGRDQTIDQGKRDSDQLRRSEGGRREAPAGAEKHHQTQQQDRTGAATQGQGKTSTDKTSAETRRPTGTQGQGKTSAESQRQTGTQAPQQQTQQNRAGAATQNQSTTGAATQSQTGQTGTGAATQAQTGATAQTQASRTTLSAQQQTTIQQSVFSASNVPRVNVNSINFAVNPGVIVPAQVSVVSVSAFPVLIDIFPDFRDDSFFVVEDEIVFLDRDRRVVEVVPAGPRTHFGSGAAATLNLSEAEIREVQLVLIERGLLTGVADGRLGPRTEEALITFQRQQGFETTGRIDSRTVASLGLSNRIGQQTGQATGSQSSTIGQGQTGTAQQPSAQQNTTGQANAPTPQNQSTGQVQGGVQQPAQQNTQAPAQQTTGQAAPQSQSTVGQGGNQPAVNQNNMQSGQGNAPAPSGQGNMRAPAQNPSQNQAR